MYKFLDDRLDKAMHNEYTEHIKHCSNCSFELDIRGKLYKELPYKSLAAPDNFVEGVMNEVKKIEDKRVGEEAFTWAHNNGVILKRLGLSMVLTAGIMLLSISVPMLSYKPLYSVTGPGTVTKNLVKVNDIIININYSVRHFIRSVDNSIERVREA